MTPRHLLARAIPLALSAILPLACSERPPVTPTPPAGAFVVTGTVSDTAFRAVPGAAVEVVAESGSVTVTDANGHYTLSGMAPPRAAIVIRASADGYAPASRTMTAQNEGVRLPPVSLQLVPAEPLALTGNHVLTIEADPACVGLPQDVRRRVYDAQFTVHPDRTSFTLGLSGASFFQNLQRVHVVVHTSLDYVVIPLYGPADLFDDPPLVEVLNDSYISLWGSARAATTPGSPVISSTFDGTFGYCAEPSTSAAVPTCPVVEVTCRSIAHRLTLARR